MGRIHIIGDSHSLLFQNPEVESHWLGAATAFQVWKKHYLIRGIVPRIDKDDEFWFMLGEIDCRIHIYSKSQELRIAPLDFMIKKTVESYVGYLSYFYRSYPVFVMATPPQGPVGNVFNYQYYADQETRQKIAHRFNQELEESAKEAGLGFVDLYKPYWDKVSKKKSCFDRATFKEDESHLRNDISTKCLEGYLAANRNKRP